MMHRESCVCGMDSLEMFQVPPTPTNIALEYSKSVSCTFSSDTAPIEFEIKGQVDENVDLSQTYLQVLLLYISIYLIIYMSDQISGILCFYRFWFWKLLIYKSFRIWITMRSCF